MDDSNIFLENFEMLKALYDFNATFAKTLSFKEDDLFLLYQKNTKQRNWWQVINEKGDIGFVPSNYVKQIEVVPSFMLQFLDTCILFLQNDTSLIANTERNELLLRLKEKRRQAEMNIGGIHIKTSSVSSSVESFNASSPPQKANETRSAASFSPVLNDTEKIRDLKYGSRSNDFLEEPIKPVHKQLSGNIIKHSIENIHQEVLKEQKSQLKSEQNSSSSLRNSIINIEPQNVYELVEAVRINTKLSHEMSQIAVTTVITQLQEMLPPSVSPHLSKILSYSKTQLTAEQNVIGKTHDANRLRLIFKELIYCKEDSQQRSWMLYEDETIISEYISELISILSNADPSISKHMIAIDDYRVVFALIQYYQMEIRWSIRQLLLQAFGVMCSLDKTVVSIMLNSVLPMELARDMQENARNISKLNYSCLLLTMIFSMGEQMPITHLEQIGYDFLNFVLNAIEDPPDTDVDEQISDLFLNFVLAFNLQYSSNSHNIVLNTLAERTIAKTFTEKILLLLNREEDPVRIFEHEPIPPDSILKLFIDMFGKESTASLFYTNDVKVLIDIIVRQLSDLSPGDKKREQYLRLCRRILRNTNYNEHRHRYDDIHKCFTRILSEEMEYSINDRQLIYDITNEFPQIFKM
ncbi:uncharacterized protein CBL_00341 [Carabus blaptoides fortunei]